MVELMTNAKECVFQVKFGKQIDPKYVQSQLEAVKNVKELHDKDLAKAIAEGETVTMTCFLTKSENSLGRSVVIDLNQPYN